MAGVTARLEKQHPATNRDVVVRRLKDNVVGDIESPLLMMLGAVGFVLLIACANVAHLMLARTSDRQREIAVRAALGAGKVRLIAQFLTESLLLSSIGAIAGLFLAYGGIKALVALAPADIPRLDLIAIDSRVLFFLIAVTGLTAVAFGLAPAMQSAAGNLSDTLKEGGRGDSSGKRRGRLRSFLVASEFALAFTLLIGAGLMVRSFYALQSVNTGFNPHNVLTMIVSVAGTNEEGAARRRVFYRDLLEQLKALPGVEAAGGINHLPIAGDLWDRNLWAEGHPKPRPGEALDAIYRIAMPGYFDAMRLPIVKGRAITYGDDEGAPPVVMINQKAAEKFWPGENPIGKHLQLLGSDEDGRPNWLTVIGVTANARLDDMTSPPYPELYLAALQTPEFMGEGSLNIGTHMMYLTVVIRSKEAPSELLPQVRHVVESFDPALPISQVMTMDEAVAIATAQPRFEMWLLAANVSTSLRELQGWGLVRVVHVMGDRRDHFDTIHDVWEMFTLVVEERKRREIDPTITMLRECSMEIDRNTPQDKEARKRIKDLLTFFEQATAVYDEFRSLPGGILRQIWKLKGGLKRVFTAS